ncbi:MAG: hypothetical protein IJ461_03965 [Clostridia bacterium]|nr:hypothetical protein [Clostridia bacterium]
MAWLSWIYLLWMVFITPITVQVRFVLAGSFWVKTVIHIWGMPWTFKPKKKENKSQRNSEFPKQLWKVFRRSPKVRQQLSKAIQWQFLGLRGVIASPRADWTALLWGGAQGIQHILEGWLKTRKVPFHLWFRPDFNRQTPVLEGGCILFARLGNLLALGLLFAWEYGRMRAAEKGEISTWSIQSGA